MVWLAGALSFVLRRHDQMAGSLRSGISTSAVTADSGALAVRGANSARQSTLPIKVLSCEPSNSSSYRIALRDRACSIGVGPDTVDTIEGRSLRFCSDSQSLA